MTQHKPITTTTKPQNKKKARSTARKRPRLPTKENHDDDNDKKKNHHHHAFVPTCSRLLPFDHRTRSCVDVSTKNNNSTSGGRVRNVRGVQDKTRGRRANQRRMIKMSPQLDRLVGREQQLRFDRSSIHAWGVFADTRIAAGEMVVEYRGEIIGNAVAEKRDGHDYMFRIDGSTVCDATKQGNVARFINASCGPNCYTQIITLDGTKRIVIYAKKNIAPGQELSYDYKFPLEYNRDKRLPCHCGQKDCRGYLNWNKKYATNSMPRVDDAHQVAQTP